MIVLYIVLKFGNYDICEYILNNEIFRFKSCVCDVLLEGKNVCYYVVEVGFVDIIMFLVKKGINVIVVINNKENIFYIVCIYDWLEMCKYIFSEFYDFMIVKCEDGWNVILYVVKNGYVEILKFLKEKNIFFDY